VIAGQDQHELVMRDRQLLKPVQLAREPSDQAHVDLPLPQSLYGLTGVRLNDFKDNAGVVALERPGRLVERGEKGYRYDKGQPKRSCLAPSRLHCHFVHALNLCQGGLRFPEHQASCRREFDSFVYAREQLHSQIALHCPNPLRQWRLGHVESLRSPAEMRLLRNSHKAGELSHGDMRWHDATLPVRNIKTQ